MFGVGCVSLAILSLCLTSEPPHPGRCWGHVGWGWPWWDSVSVRAGLMLAARWWNTISRIVQEAGYSHSCCCNRLWCLHALMSTAHFLFISWPPLVASLPYPRTGYYGQVADISRFESWTSCPKIILFWRFTTIDFIKHLCQPWTRQTRYLEVLFCTEILILVISH